MAKTKAVPREPLPGLPDLTRLFKALGDTHRLQILLLLAHRGEMHVSAIGGELGQSQPAASHHLTLLRNAGLIEFRRDGKFNYYSLSETGLLPIYEKLFGNLPGYKLPLAGIEIGLRRKA